MAFHLNGYSNFHDDNQDWIVSKIKSIEDTEAHTEELAEAAQNSADASQASAEASQLSAEASQLSAEASQQSAENAAESETNAAQSELSAKNYADHIADPVAGLVTTWLTDHITNPSNPPIDTSLTVAGAAADAKKTGDEISDLKSALTNDYAPTDNLYSNLPSEWKQGGVSDSRAYIASMTETFPVEDKPIYVWITSLMSFGAILYLMVFDSSDVEVGNYQCTNNVSRSRNLHEAYPTGSYFKILIDSGVGTNHISPSEAALKFKSYVGYSEANTANAWYPKYIQKQALYVMNEKEPVANELTDKFGVFATSLNTFSNYSGDWEQGENGTGGYRSSMINKFPVLSGYFYIWIDSDSVPEDVKTNGTLYIRILDESDTVLFTISRQFNNQHIYMLDVLNSYPTAKKYSTHITSGVGSVNVTPEIASSINCYIGFMTIGSNVTTELTPQNHYVSQYSRKLIDGGYLPDYWLSYLHNKAIELSEKDEAIGAHGISFAFITDQHWSSNFQQSTKILKWLKDHTNLRRIVGGGDVLNNYNSIAEAMHWLNDWRDSTNGLDVRNIRGNHDNNSVGTESQYHIGDGRFYAALIRPIEEQVNIEGGHLYYYEKINSQKVCIFYLDTGDLSTDPIVDFDAQISWMNGIVSNLASDWSILVIQHVYWDGHSVSSFGQKIKAYLDTVTNCSVIGVVCGHEHYDYDETTERGYKVIATTSDSAIGDLASERIEGTTTEQAFDVFHIDTYNKVIYVTRIGAGNSRQFTYA